MGVLLVLVGLALLLAGWLLLRSGGSGWRVGRLLAAAPQRDVAEAVAMASRGEQAYVRVHGRIDSREEFPGDEAQPLVYLRRRLQTRPAGALRIMPSGADWRSFGDERTAVPFGLAERGERISLDVEALGDGLVVVPRVSEGQAADLPPTETGESRRSLSPEAPVRLRIDQVGTTDHGTACGVPRLSPSGEAILGSGLGRPLILTNLDLDDAMRVLGADQRGRLRAATAALVAAPLVVGLGLLVTLLGW